MSQIYKASTGGGGGAITTIDGDSGSVTGATIDLYANTGSANTGASVSFTAASATEMDLVLSDGNFSIFLGENSGNLTTTGTNNVGLGPASLTSLTTGAQNCAIGFATGNGITTGQDNTIIGWASGNAFTTGTYNSIIGYTSGQNYTSSESSNILINNLGVIGESNVTRIGTQEAMGIGQNECFIAGIVGVTVSNAQTVMIDSTTGQLGVSAGGGGGITTINGDSGSVTGATVDIYSNTGSANCGASVSFTAASATEMDLVLSDAFLNTFLGRSAGGTTLAFALQNVGCGGQSLGLLTSGGYNSGFGFESGYGLTTGSQHTTGGCYSNAGVSGTQNLVLGYSSGSAYSGAESYNIVLASTGVLGESNAIHIGGGTGSGVGQQNLCTISGIQGITVTGAAVLVSATDQLGIAVSSIKYKENIAPMGECSNAIFDLNPSIFNYKHDPDKQRKFGLIAEEVEKILPELVLYDAQGELQSVAYHDLPVLLLNEIQKLRDYVIRLENRVFELESA